MVISGIKPEALNDEKSYKKPKVVSKLYGQKHRASVGSRSHRCLMDTSYIVIVVYARLAETLEKLAAFEQISQYEFETVDSIYGDQALDIRRARLLSLTPMPKEGLEYDPRDHRTPTNEIGPCVAYFNLLRIMCGTGLLGMPVAFSASGYVIGCMFTLLTGGLIIHTHHLLLNCLNEISRQLKIPYISYRYGFRIALLHGPEIFHCIGHRGPTIVGMLMIMTQLGIGTTSVIMTTDSLKDIADFQTITPSYAILLPFNLLFDVCMKNLHHDRLVGICANTLNTVGLGLIFYHMLKEPRQEVVGIEPDVGGWLLTSGICIFNLSAVGQILTTDKALKNPRIMVSRFGVINVGLGIPTVIYLIFGLLGYLTFGTMDESVLRSLPFEETSSMVAIGLFMVAVLLSYPLQCHPAIEVIVEMIKYRKKHRIPTQETLHLIQAIARPVFILTSFLIAFKIPFQGPFRAFVGHLCTTLLSVVFPAMMDMCLRFGTQNGYGKYKYYLVKDLSIMCLGFITWLLGIYYCGYLLYNRILSSYSPNSGGFL